MTTGQVDPRFRQMGSGARRRRRRAAIPRWTGFCIVAATAAGLGWHFARPDLGRLFGGGDVEQSMVQVESGFDIAPVVRGDTFTDIPGDPLVIAPPDDGTVPAAERVPVPAGLAADPRLRTRAATLRVMEGRLVPRDRQLVASLPSTREEFALFHAERSRSRLAEGGGIAPVAAEARPTGSVTFLRDANARNGLWRDLILEATREVALSELLAGNGFDPASADALAARIEAQMSLDGPLPQGSVLALRYRMQGEARQVIQASLYGPGGYVGSLALSAAGQLVPAADAWADQPLLDQVMARQDGEPAPQQRLLDLIYSAALLNDIRPEIAGQAVAMLAKVHDLDSLADPEDRLTLILRDDGAGTASGSGAGTAAGSAVGTATEAADAILFIGVDGPGGPKPCYVVPQGGGFECFAPSARVAVGRAQLTPPVIGVLSQRFVPAAAGADDPGRGRVAWSAPQGTPVVAAGAGRVTARDGTPGGASIEITHDGGLVSRYSGLAELSATAASADVIQPGTVIGSVGGKADGEARLVFQLLQDGVPVDPVALLGGVDDAVGSTAVEALIGRIITVESAGNANARNPLSTATGLGQFIESTWLRMIRSYRPDMAASLDRTALLALRFDPDLSRQMVRHLAQENEAFLRARGHAITPGRLYLAHFLGPAGADMVLRADPAATVMQVMGPAVVGANPFLRGYSIADLQNWADRKMTGSSMTAGAAAPLPSIPAEILAYMQAVDRLRDTVKGG